MSDGQFNYALQGFFLERLNAIVNHPEAKKTLSAYLNAIEDLKIQCTSEEQLTALIEIENAGGEYIAALQNVFYQGGFYDGLRLSMTATANSLSLKDVS